MRILPPRLLALLLAIAAPCRSADIQHGEMFGYLLFDGERVPRQYNAGFSLYAAAWPLVDHYPGHDFQTGLLGTWMHPLWETGQKPNEECYTDIEGGLGWWRGTHFPTTTPKFIMGGVGPNFSVIANGPGYGAGTWEEERGLYGVAQLSPWLFFPLDGLNLKQGAQGELFGYGYRFTTPKEEPQEPRTTPDGPATCWKKPGPAAGPFQAHLGDGSVLTYYWYRFADQPAMLNADLTPTEREVVQQRVEKLHRAWAKDRDYLAPPDAGTLAILDPALILTPPRGMEAGYVPIATRQELAGPAARPHDHGKDRP